MNAGAAPERSGSGLYLYAVVRSRAFRGPIRNVDSPELTRVRYRELEAIARTVRFALPAADEAALREHQRVVESIMRRGTVLPIPFAVVFRDRRELIRMLESQYLALDEALSFLEGHWELRIHMGVRGDDEPTPELRGHAAHVYGELRRMSHAAQPLQPRERGILSAAYLVQRSAWVEFVERAEDLASTQPGLILDVTGPWPAYDFVKLVR